MRFNTRLRFTLLAVAGFAPAAQAANIELGDTTLTIGGYIKLDAMVTDYEAQPASAPLGNLGRDYYAGPLSVPVDDGSGGVTVTDMHVKQTRLWIKSKTKLDNGESFGAHLELDFQNSAQGNETISNSSAPRLRQAFITYGGWLFGQAWSTFQNVGALPETLDFIGPTESTIFIRQPMIRYSGESFQIALENPHSRISGAVPDTRDDNTFPDLALRWNFGSLVVAGLLRGIESQDAGGVDETEFAGGLSVSGRYAFGRDDLKFMLTAGSGLGRYLGVIANPDAIINADGAIEPIDSMAAFVAYRHFWSDKARSSIVYGQFEGDGAIESASSVHLNYLYSPANNLTLGVELMRAQRDDLSGASGAFNRLQFGAKLGF